MGVRPLVWYLYFADDSLLLWARSSGMAGHDSNSGASGQRGARSFPGMADEQTWFGLVTPTLLV